VVALWYAATVYRFLKDRQMKRVYVKEQACIGCHLCEIYCQLEHSRSKDLIKAFKKEFPQALPLVSVEEQKPVSFSVRCQHCTDAPCVYACLTGALRREPDSGIITVDTNKCMGCWTCILVCPIGAIKQDTIRKRVAKCDLCQGRDIPACVANCPNEALAYIESKEGSAN